ncbi:MAG: hypothetical protein U9P14_02310 [Gemmatimonadota bacterium]|nr:hypothetical protein [Gemmatimonadota bacterium]
MQIACVSAMKMEISWLLGRLVSVRKHKVQGGGRLWTGRLDRHQVALFCCGVGPEKARAGMLNLSEIFEAQRFYLAGVCGSLTGKLGIGTPVVASAVCSSYDQASQTAIELDLPDMEVLDGVVPGITPASGLFISHDKPVLSGSKKRSLHERYAAVCVDMEAWEVDRFCRERGLPLTVIKAVSDTADHLALLDFCLHARQAAKTSCRLIH